VVLKTETLGGRGIRNRLVCGKWHERVPDVLAQRTLRKKKTHKPETPYSTENRSPKLPFGQPSHKRSKFIVPLTG